MCSPSARSVCCVLLLMLSMIFQGVLLGQSSRTSGADFLKIRTGARQFALGGAFSGLADDENALFWNPAGLGLMSDWKVNFMHNNWLADLQLESFSVVFPNWWDRFRLGVFGVQLWCPPWDNTEGELPPGEYRDLMLGVGMARKVHPFFYFGGTAKWIQRKLGPYTFSGIAADAGMLYVRDPFSFGITVQNLGPPLHSLSAKEKLPLLICAGAGYKLYFNRWLNSILVADIGYDGIRGESFESAGLEMWLKDVVAIRFGFRFNQGVAQVSSGFGIRWKFLGVDYAFLPYQENLTSFSHPFSSYQTGIRAISLLPSPFHILHPGLDQKRLKKERGFFKGKKIRDFESLKQAVEKRFSASSPKEAEGFLRHFVFIVDPSDTLSFHWNTSRDAYGGSNVQYIFSLYFIDTLANGNLFEAYRDFLSRPKKSEHLIHRKRIRPESIGKSGTVVQYDLPLWQIKRLPEGPFLWAVRVVDQWGNLRNSRERIRGFYLYRALPPVPISPREDEEIRPRFSPAGFENLRWIEKPKKRGAELPSSRTEAEISVDLKWKPARLGIGRILYSVFLKPAYSTQPFQKVYEGFETECRVWIPYQKKKIRYVWYVVASLGKKEKRSEVRSFLISPIRLLAPNDFVVVDIEEPELNVNALAKLDPVVLEAEERVEVILDRPMIPFVFFEKGSDVIEETSQRELASSVDSILAHLRANPDVILQLRGYVDPESDGVRGKKAVQLGILRAKGVRRILVSRDSTLSDRVQVVPLDSSEVIEPRIIETVHRREEIGRIQAENRRVFMEALLRNRLERKAVYISEIVEDSLIISRINDVLVRNPDVILMVGAADFNLLVKMIQALKPKIYDDSRIYTFFYDRKKEQTPLHIYLSAEKLIYKPMMPKIVRSKLGRGILRVRHIEVRAPSPFLWKAYLAPAREVREGEHSIRWIEIDSGYVGQNYSEWRYDLHWQSSDPLDLQWDQNNPYLLVLDVELELAGIKNRFVRPVRFLPRKEDIRTYRMVLIQHVFASEESESRFLEARIQSILRDILALKPRKIENAMITGHACAIGSASYNLRLSHNRALHTYRIFNRQLQLLTELGEYGDEVRTLSSAFRNHIYAFGFWAPYRFEPELLMPGMKDSRQKVERLNQSPLQRVRNRRTEIQLTVRF